MRMLVYAVHVVHELYRLRAMPITTYTAFIIIALHTGSTRVSPVAMATKVLPTGRHIVYIIICLVKSSVLNCWDTHQPRNCVTLCGRHSAN